MNRLSIDAGRRFFKLNGNPFFYLADTLWMAFSKLTMDEWREILQKRLSQRFTVLQISLLPISHDNSDSKGDCSPFARNASGGWDFDSLNFEYFERARAMLQMAVEYGFVPCVHLLWANYVPDTWAAKRSPDTVLPLDSAKQLVEYAVGLFSQFGCVYSISGDTSFETNRVVEYYRAALDIVRKIDPGALTTLHLQPHAEVPPELSDIDFFSYQGGHRMEAEWENHHNFALYYWSRPEKKPVVNSEPPYEGHGHGFSFGRFGADELRQAAWQSLLSGASAGVTYGAHGLWSMHRAGQAFSSVEFSNTPFDWRTALNFPGAWEFSRARELFERHDLFGLTPLDALDERFPFIRAAASDDLSTLAVYSPYACDIHLKIPLAGYDIVLYEMKTSRRLQCAVAHVRNHATLVMPQVNSDLLYIAIKRRED